jgi:superfamily II DNA or RNA helicase
MTPTPRPYQRRAIAATYAAIKAGKRCPLVVAPTGAGKTLIMALMVRDVVSRGKRAAIFAHRTELRDQAVATLARCGVEAGHSGQGRSLPVQIVSTQGAVAREEVPEADVVFPDEAHHYAGAPEWKRVLDAYPTQQIIGFTATPERADGRGMGDTYDALIVAAQPRELVALGHLVDCHILRPSTLHEPGSMCMSPLAAYQHIGAVGRNVVFAATIDHACKFVAEFKMSGIDAALVHGGLAPDVRARALESFTSGRVRVLVNVFVLTEGFDCPAIDVVTLARNMGSTSMFMQSCGRGLRTAPGKERMTLLDLPGVSHVHGSPLDDRVFSLDGIGMRLAKDAGPRFCRACGGLLEEVGPCPKCQRSRRGAVKDPIYSRDPLEKFAKFKTDDEATRIKRLAKFLAQAHVQRFRPGWAFAKYKAVYQVAPSPKIVQVAMMMARGA